LLERASGSLHMRLGVLCDHAMIGQDGKLSLIGIFDHIGVVQLPAQHPRFYVVCVLQGEARNPYVEMELNAPNGQTLMHEQIGINPDMIAQGSGNLIAEVTMLPLEMTGRFEFRIIGDGQVLGLIPLSVDAVEPNPAGAPQAMPRA